MPQVCPNFVIIMKRYICHIVIACLCVVAAQGQLSESKMRSIIERCDVADTVIHSTTSQDFWLNLQCTNSDYRSVAKSLASKGDKDVKRNLIHVLAESSEYFINVPVRSDAYDTMEHMATTMGIRAVSRTATFTVTQEPDIALFGYPNGYMYMSNGLYREIASDTMAIRAMLASEAAHYALQHAYGHARQEKKRDKRIRNVAMILNAALLVTSAITEQPAVGALTGMGSDMAGIIADVPLKPRYTMTYTPRQVFEADIVAYRYMEWCAGSGEYYIDALSKVGFDIDAANVDKSKGYPTVSERLALLRYLHDNPQLRSTVKVRNAKPKEVKSNFEIFSPSNYN